MRDVVLALVSGLKGATGVKALLADDEAVFTAVAPQGQRRRYIVLHVLSDPSTYALEGGRVGLGRPLVQVESWGDTAEAVLELAAAVDDFLEGLAAEPGDLGTGDAAAGCLGAFKRDSRGPIASELLDGSAGRAFVVQADVEVWLRRT